MVRLDSGQFEASIKSAREIWRIHQESLQSPAITRLSSSFSSHLDRQATTVIYIDICIIVFNLFFSSSSTTFDFTYRSPATDSTMFNYVQLYFIHFYISTLYHSGRHSKRRTPGELSGRMRGPEAI